MIQPEIRFETASTFTLPLKPRGINVNRLIRWFGFSVALTVAGQYRIHTDFIRRSYHSKFYTMVIQINSEK